MSKRIVPIGRKFDNWQAALASVTEGRAVENLVIWFQPDSGNPEIITHNLTRAQATYAAAQIVDYALYSDEIE